ncbi:MAG: metallophosphoesterase family protein [Candidatus Goldbacteria bacterium]|nr:metallophosphoesterase family protein [Candidatus Goldiibacteriota bacterium]HPD18347.1 metallophosphoesterase family protein [Candidatus Goldiibacteriota bacterium]
MRYAIISDIHSNLEALNSVLEFLQLNSVDKIICCGDIVGYGPDPKQCINKLRLLNNFSSVMGNHDAVIINKTDISNFNNEAKEAAKINKSMISKDEMDYINSLKTTLSENDALFVHGSPRDPINEYLFLLEKFNKVMSFFTEKICFVGHTHHPIVFESDGKDDNNFFQNIDVFKLKDNKRYIINVGSVGQPRDNNPQACVVFFDTKYLTVSFKRLSYDIEKTQIKMSKLNMPDKLIQRLSFGV